ncbi:MAG TPA: glycosyltransferase family 2 protein [Candidatus Saccharimonadales bacterium]|nr:glycosyltransferase family 2 protein [Candidatus Saccharimonadales bacterium]
MKKSNTVSIVIPVYNEAAHLPACLEAISQQTVRPYEVIVVDNNSTDETAAIAGSYDFVRVITEKKQGVVHARERGFNAARGTVIGRIDADTVIESDWVARLQQLFADPSIGGVTGRVKYHDMALGRACNAVDFKIRTYLENSLGDEVAMQGANMALRRSVWRDARDLVCREGGLHEDMDLSVHVHEAGHKVVFDPSMVAAIGYRQAESSYRKFAEYIMLSPKTYAMHGRTSQRRMYPACMAALVCFLLIKALHRGYDKDADKFSWVQLFSSPQQRVNPATYVDY